MTLLVIVVAKTGLCQVSVAKFGLRKASFIKLLFVIVVN